VLLCLMIQLQRGPKRQSQAWQATILTWISLTGVLLSLLLLIEVRKKERGRDMIFVCPPFVFLDSFSKCFMSFFMCVSTSIPHKFPQTLSPSHPPSHLDQLEIPQKFLSCLNYVWRHETKNEKWNEKWKMKNEKRKQKIKNEKWKTKNEKQNMKNKKWKTENEIRKIKNWKTKNYKRKIKSKKTKMNNE